jgi:hypothetical protein
MITLDHAYIVGGFFFAALAILTALDNANPLSGVAMLSFCLH